MASNWIEPNIELKIIINILVYVAVWNAKFAQAKLFNLKLENLEKFVTINDLMTQMKILFFISVPAKHKLDKKPKKRM